MPSTPSRRRWSAAIILVLLAVAGFWWWRQIRPRYTVEALLGRLPAEAAVRLFVDVPKARTSPAAGGLLANSFLAGEDWFSLAAGLRAAAVSIERENVSMLAALDLSAVVAQRYLSRRRLECQQGLDEAVCAIPSPQGGFVSLRLADDELLAIVHGPSESAANALVDQRPVAPRTLAAAEQALAGPAWLWAEIDPSRLDALMQNPPEGWVNLSLVARALRPAERADLTLHDAPEGLVVTLSAECPDEAGARELVSILEGLNKMALPLLRAAKDPALLERWRPMAESFEAETAGATAKASWAVPQDALAGLFDR